MQAQTRGLTAAERWTLRLAPALGVAAVAASALLMTEPDARWARLYAGPTDQPGSLVWRLAVKRGGLNQAFAACSGEVTASFGQGQTTTAHFITDAEGVAWVTLARPTSDNRAAIDVRVTEGQRLLAEGRVQVTRPQWLAHARREGGVCSGYHEGPIAIQVGVVHGVVLHGYPAALVVTLADQGRPWSNQPVFVETEGAKILGARNTSQVMLATNQAGSAELTVVATDMAATLSVKVPEPHASHLTAALPIRAGGLYVQRNGADLFVSTTAGPTLAWLGLLSEQGLLEVRALELTAKSGQFSAALRIADWPQVPAWAVVSGEPELESGNTIGWPLLDESELSAAHSTLVVPELLALDGQRLVQRRIANQRERVLITSCCALIVVAALLIGVMVRSNRRHKRAVGDLEQWLDGAQPPPLADKTPLALIAIIVTTAALMALAFWVAH